jgi:hypothetical protein
MATSKQPYEYEDVVAILIKGLNEFLYIRKGSLVEGEVGDGIKTLTATDHYDGGSKVFLFANNLLAVKYEPENLQVVDGGVAHMPRPLP